MPVPCRTICFLISVEKVTWPFCPLIKALTHISAYAGGKSRRAVSIPGGISHRHSCPSSFSIKLWSRGIGIERALRAVSPMPIVADSNECYSIKKQTRHTDADKWNKNLVGSKSYVDSRQHARKHLKGSFIAHLFISLSLAFSYFNWETFLPK